MYPELVDQIVAEVIAQLRQSGCVVLPASKHPDVSPQLFEEDIVSPASKARALLDAPMDEQALARMKKQTTARIGVGRCGARLKTQTALALRADHANARDAVFADVDPALLESLGLFQVQSSCKDKDTFLTRPDLGRKLEDQTLETLKMRCAPNPDVQIYAADGLSSKAIEANLAKILPILMQALKDKGLTVGTPFFLRYGRVGSEEYVAEALGAKVVCVLLGERPGLATAESMSAYIAYNAYVGMPESKRTVVSNIHKNGTAAVEAGAYIAEVIAQIFEQKASGVDLVK